MALKALPHPERERSEQSKDAWAQIQPWIWTVPRSSDGWRADDAGFGERGDLGRGVAQFDQHRLCLLAERGDTGFRRGLGVRHAEGRVQRAERAALVVDFGERAALRALRIVHRFLYGAIRR